MGGLVPRRPVLGSGCSIEAAGLTLSRGFLVFPGQQTPQGGAADAERRSRLRLVSVAELDRLLSELTIALGEGEDCGGIAAGLEAGTRNLVRLRSRLYRSSPCKRFGHKAREMGLPP